jgi:hypothetical protein
MLIEVNDDFKIDLFNRLKLSNINSRNYNKEGI